MDCPICQKEMNPKANKYKCGTCGQTCCNGCIYYENHANICTVCRDKEIHTDCIRINRGPLTREIQDVHQTGTEGVGTVSQEQKYSGVCLHCRNVHTYAESELKNKDNPQAFCKTCTYMLSVNPTPPSVAITLSLPPLPGTNTAHPAFKIGTRNTAYFKTGIETWNPVRLNGVFNTVAAAAIAHYWNVAYIMSPHKGKSIPRNQWLAWSEIAAGSREYDGAEIVGYGAESKTCDDPTMIDLGA